MKRIISNLIPIFLLFSGLFIVGMTSSIISSPRTACVISLLLFALFNLTTARFLNLSGKLRKAWAGRKVWHLIFGFVIGLIPMGAAYWDMSSRNQLPAFKGISAIGCLFTFMSVSWEELWFRGVSLEAAGIRYSKMGACLIFGVIFMLMHLLNPKINLINDGPELLIAGYMLCVCYFAFESIWAPIGLHFANNLAQAVFGMSTEPHSLFYLTPLTLIAVMMAISLRKKRTDDDYFLIARGEGGHSYFRNR